MIQIGNQLIAVDLSSDDLRRIQDSIGAIVRINDSWQSAECENGLNIALINPASCHWDDGAPGEVATFISKRGGSVDISAIGIGTLKKTQRLAILTSSGEIIADLSKEDLRALQDCMSLLLGMDDSWSACRGDTGIGIAVTNTNDSTNVEDARRWLAEHEARTD